MSSAAAMPPLHREISLRSAYGWFLEAIAATFLSTAEMTSLAFAQAILYFFVSIPRDLVFLTPIKIIGRQGRCSICQTQFFDGSVSSEMGRSGAVGRQEVKA